MGFLSKLWKGIKKTFKKIFKPIKKAFKSFGKFMNKIGIVGQIAMSFILPGIGNALLNTFGKAAGWLAGGSLGAVGEAAGWVLGKAVEFGKFAVEGYKTVTGAVTDFIGTAGKFIGGKLGIGNLPSDMTLGEAWGEYTSKLSDSFSKLGNAAKEFWDTDIKGATLPSDKDLSKIYGESSVNTDAVIDEAANLGKVVDDPMAPKFKDVATSKISADPMNPNYKPSILGKQSTPAAVETAATSADKGWLETLTGEKTFGDVGRKLAAETKEYAYAAPGKALSSVATTALGQAAGVIAKPPGEMGPDWYARSAGLYAAPVYSATSQGLQPVSFEDYTQTYSLGGDTRGSWLGNSFWDEYMKRMAVA